MEIANLKKENQNRWFINQNSIVWDIKNEPPRRKQRGIFDTALRDGVQNKESPQAARYCTPVHNNKIPHEDFLEMSGKKVSLIIHYGVNENKNLILYGKAVWPSLRIIPNDTYGCLKQDYESEFTPDIKINGEKINDEKPEKITFDGILRIQSEINSGFKFKRTIFPSTELPVVVEIIEIENNSGKSANVSVNTSVSVREKRGVHGIYMLETKNDAPENICIENNASLSFGVYISGRHIMDNSLKCGFITEENKRKAFIYNITNSLKLSTPDQIINRAFDFAKIRAAESIFDTKGGLMHSPGGEDYYAAVWTNDQAEYAGPFFPFLGDKSAVEASLNCYRLYMRFMGHEFVPIPSSIIAEGEDIWEGAGDRGDAAMYAYGASRFALETGNIKTAQELFPAIKWCIEFCKRKLNSYGVVNSDSDELEGRFPSGSANLSTSSLFYGALKSAACLAAALGENKTAEEYTTAAEKLSASIEDYFGSNVEGFDTYRYYEGNTKLRSWICLPLTMGILSRKSGTIEALFSENLWTKDGLATESGNEVFWDRSTLYGLRGVFYAGEADKAIDYFQNYSQRRLLGEHVPYAVEAYPEGNQRHLSAESALYCRVVTEGLFGINPTGLKSFTCRPSLPECWDSMSLKSIKAFGCDFDILIERIEDKIKITIKQENHSQEYFCRNNQDVLINL